MTGHWQRVNPKPEHLHYGWKGDDVGNKALHKWVRKHKIRTGVCQYCGKEPGLPGGPAGTDFANISGEYHRDLDDYWELCRSCHRRYDSGSLGVK